MTTDKRPAEVSQDGLDDVPLGNVGNYPEMAPASRTDGDIDAPNPLQYFGLGDAVGSFPIVVTFWTGGVI